MTKKNLKFKIKTFPRTRQITSELFDQAVLHHVVHGLYEFDVSKIMQYINLQKQKGNLFSFSAYFIFCLAKAVKEFEILNSMRYGNRKVIIFDDVDISFLFESENNFDMSPIIYVIKAADKKTFQEINNEIQNLKEKKKEFFNEQEKNVKSYYLIPKFIRKLIIKRKYRYDPFFRKKYGGTICVSSLGKFVQGWGYGIPISGFTLFAIIGAISKKAVVNNDKIEIRELVNTTFSVDHDLVDGAPGVRFGMRFKELFESGYGLDFKD